MDTMAWATQDAKTTAISGDLTVKFIDPFYRTLGEITAPILRSATFSTFGKNENGYDFFQASLPRTNQFKSGTETIKVTARNRDIHTAFTKIRVKNDFRASVDEYYTCELSLSRVNPFLLLDQTNWQIKDIKVFGLSKDVNGNSVYGDPKNYPVYFDPTSDDKVKITLLTKLDDGDGELDFKINDQV